MRRRILKAAAAIATVIAAGLVGGFFWLRGSLPAEQGEISVTGLSAPVQIIRDQHGIPTIHAQSDHDGYFALGFVHAEDRLWQMDLARRAGAGRLAEIVGPEGVKTDKLIRTLGLYRLAQAEIESLDPPTRAAFEAYAAGVNAYLAGHQGAWPIEYYLLRTRPSPWRIEDSLVFGRLMALRLATDFHEEMERAQLLHHLTPAQISDLWPSYPPNWPKGVSDSLPPDAEKAFAAIPWRAIEDALPQTPLRASASNCWVVDGKHSSNGKPLLANDPHLSFEAPGTWYMARIETPGLVLAGATMPGLPFVVLGHNENIAWGLTSSYVDTQDLFIERVDDADSSRYVTPGGNLPFDTRKETIHVRGGGDIELNVRSTRHGPVISDVVAGAENFPSPSGGGTYVLALGDAGLRGENHTADAFYALDHAKNADGVAAALSQFDTPPQNVVFADRDGNIGFYSVGRVPLRKTPDGLFPVPGWSGDYDWTGIIPFAQLPHVLNPESGRIIAANNRAIGEDYPFPLSAYWPSAYRAKRIGEMLDDLSPLSPAESAAMQLDTVSVAARDLMPLLLGAPVNNDRARAAQAMLGHWDGDLKRDRPEPLIYSAWLLELGQGMIASRLGDMAGSVQAVDPMVISHLLNDRPSWCDDPATKAAETCGEAVAAALDRALDRLAKAYGADMTRWRWGDAHRAHFRNPILSQVPLLGDLADIEISSSGDDSTVNRGSYAGHGAEPFRHVHGPGLRAVYDLADLDGALFMTAPGQSGNLLSSHYGDFAEPWRNGQYLLIAGGPGNHATRTLTLEPLSQ